MYPYQLSRLTAARAIHSLSGTQYVNLTPGTSFRVVRGAAIPSLPHRLIEIEAPCGKLAPFVYQVNSDSLYAR